MSRTDEVAELLAQEASYLDDDGFTARTLQRLPPRRARQRLRVLGIAFGLAVLTALLLLPDLLALLQHLGNVRVLTAALESGAGFVPLVVFAAVVALAVTAVVTSDEAS